MVITARKRNCSKVMFLHPSISHSVHGGLCPSMHHRSRDWGLSVQGGVGVSVQQGGQCPGGESLSSSGVSVQEGDLCPGVLCLEGLCPVGFLSGEGRSLSGGGGLCWGVCQGDPPVW